MLIPEVRELLASGKLNEFDADWIGRLKPTSQLAAAVKCMGANFTTVNDRPVSRVGSGNGHAGRDAR